MDGLISKGDILIPAGPTSRAIANTWNKPPHHLEKTVYLDVTDAGSMESQHSKLRVRGRLMQASRREADARLEADMLAADIAELNDQFQKASTALKQEQQQRQLLEQAIVVRCWVPMPAAAVGPGHDPSFSDIGKQFQSSPTRSMCGL